MQLLDLDGGGSSADWHASADWKLQAVPCKSRPQLVASHVGAALVGALLGALLLGGETARQPAAEPAASHAGGGEADDRVPEGWLVERLFHEPIRCPWLADGAEPDAACVARVDALTAMGRQLSTCEDPLRRTDKTYGHRGAALVAPEETLASFEVAAQSGAAFVECDASVTRDLQLVCRHGTCDLATTTDIVANHPELHARCTSPFVPGSGTRATCCTYDFDLAELSELCSVMDGITNADATTTEGYLVGAPSFRTDGIGKAKCHKLVSLSEHLGWLRTKRLDAIPELKDTASAGVTAFLAAQTPPRDCARTNSPLVRAAASCARKPRALTLLRGPAGTFLADLIAAEVSGAGFTQAWNADASTHRGYRSILQTFDHRVAARWLTTQALSVEYMPSDESILAPPLSESQAQKCLSKPSDRCDNVAHLIALGVDVVAPSIQHLVQAGPDHTIVPTEAAQRLRALGASIGSWSAERQGCTDDAALGQRQPSQLGPCLHNSGYYGSTEGSVFQHIDVLRCVPCCALPRCLSSRLTRCATGRVLDVLFKDVGLVGMFADFPASVSAYVNCILDQ